PDGTAFLRTTTGWSRSATTAPGRLARPAPSPSPPITRKHAGHFCGAPSPRSPRHRWRPAEYASTATAATATSSSTGCRTAPRSSSPPAAAATPSSSRLSWDPWSPTWSRAATTRTPPASAGAPRNRGWRPRAAPGGSARASAGLEREDGVARSEVVAVGRHAPDHAGPRGEVRSFVRDAIEGLHHLHDRDRLP